MNLDKGQAAILTDGMSEGADGKWLASEIADDEPRQNGKGTILEARALAGLYLLKEPLIIWTAHEFKTAHEGFLRMRTHIDNYDHLRKRVKSIRSSTHAVEFELLGGQRLSFLARSGGSGRGFASVAPLFLDEAFALTDEQMAALIFAMSAHPNPQVWYMSSAPLADSAVLRSICVRGRKGAPGLVYYEWSASGERAELEKLVRQNKELSIEEAQTPDGRQLRTRLFKKVAEANRAFNVRIAPSSILRELAATGVEQFLRERLGIWSEFETGVVIDLAEWAKLADPKSRRAGDVAIGVDVGRELDGRAWSAIGLFGLRDDGLGHAQLLDYRQGTDWIAPRLVELRDTLDPVAVGMARGTAAALEAELAAVGIARPQDPDQPRRGDLAVLSAADMAAACGQAIDAVRNKGLRQVPSPQWDASVAGARTRKVGDTIAWARSSTDADITPVVATPTVARWTYYARVDAMAIDDYDPVSQVF